MRSAISNREHDHAHTEDRDWQICECRNGEERLAIDEVVQPGSSARAARGEVLILPSPRRHYLLFIDSCTLVYMSMIFHVQEHILTNAIVAMWLKSMSC